PGRLPQLEDLLVEVRRDLPQKFTQCSKLLRIVVSRVNTKLFQRLHVIRQTQRVDSYVWPGAPRWSLRLQRKRYRGGPSDLHAAIRHAATTPAPPFGPTYH